MQKLCPPRQLRLVEDQISLHLARKGDLHIGMNGHTIEVFKCNRCEECDTWKSILMWLLKAHLALKGHLESVHMMNLLWGFDLVEGAQKERNRTPEAVMPDFCGVQQEGWQARSKEDSTQVSGSLHWHQKETGVVAYMAASKVLLGLRILHRVARCWSVTGAHLGQEEEGGGHSNLFWDLAGIAELSEVKKAHAIVAKGHGSNSPDQNDMLPNNYVGWQMPQVDQVHETICYE